MRVIRANHRPSIKSADNGVWAVYCLSCSALRGSLVRCKTIDKIYPKYLADAAYKDTIERLQRGNSVDSNTMSLSKKARDTSRAAVAKNIGRAGTKKRKVYDLIVRHGGLTDDEIEVLTGHRHESASSSRNRLMNDGFVYASEERRRTRQGNKAIVWKAVDEDQAK